ncbi:MAG: flagellar motor switch phosphatase FliY [Paenibacillaceae bacterium ZCTH02-B3]|nr:MAG: flagellar motor switch phosphatase FliY [Paenibacillaceae bacterium ZCTH02-B3]
MTGKDYLSQEEIDALLRQNSADDSEEGKEITDIYDVLTPLEQDALGEIGNITFGSAATALSTLLGKKVEITTPHVSLIHRNKLEDEFPKPHVAVHVSYLEGFEGVNALIIRTSDAAVIADLMLGGDGHPKDTELNEIHISAVQEAMNQMMGSAATSMSTIFNRLVNISPPGIVIMDAPKGIGLSSIPEGDILIKISFRLTIEDLVDSTIMQLQTIPFAKELVASLMGSTQSQPEPAPAAAGVSSPPPAPAAAGASRPEPVMSGAAYGGQAGGPAGGPPGGPAGGPMEGPPAGQPHTYGAMTRNVSVQPVQFGSIGGGGYPQAEQTNLDLLLDIPLKVTVELGRTHKQIKEILELSQGSVIELDKLAGEPVDILVNNKLIAKGEVVVIDENFGVRVTDIISQWDRIQKI